MLIREDKYILNEAVCNTYMGEHVAKFSDEVTLAGLQDLIGGLIEAAPEASSFVFTIVRVSHTSDDRSEDDARQTAH